MTVTSNDITITLILGLILLIIGTLVFIRFIKVNKKYLKGNFNIQINVGCR
ncbi:hypothetical protein [Romboutsia weinsteinii]|uniref:hypothetical protein n=1 Tax=Romboutsia weinsteinii TaxID=2020949 RepID=UPI001314E645|nr:hypothetical protein [Romboutsia weinsteinii]